jgi:hypothetical protein
MSQSPLVVLCECASSIEAETIRIRLTAADIRAFVTGTDAATALGLGGAGTMRLVRVEVGAEDYDCARVLLQQDQLRLQQAGPWICSRCGEQNEAAFEVCWSCTKPRTDDDQHGRINQQTEPDAALQSPISVKPPADRLSFADSNPYRPVLLPDQPRDQRTNARTAATDETSDDVTRCLRAAIVGVFLFPPIISLYSAYMLIHLNSDVYRDQRLRRRVIAAWCVNFVAIPAWLLYWRGQFSH